MLGVPLALALAVCIGRLGTVLIGNEERRWHSAFLSSSVEPGYRLNQ